MSIKTQMSNIYAEIECIVKNNINFNINHIFPFFGEQKVDMKEVKKVDKVYNTNFYKQIEKIYDSEFYIETMNKQNKCKDDNLLSFNF